MRRRILVAAAAVGMLALTRAVGLQCRRRRRLGRRHGQPRATSRSGTRTTRPRSPGASRWSRRGTPTTPTSRSRPRRSRPGHPARSRSPRRSPPATLPASIFNTSPAAVPGFQKQGGLVNLSEFEDGDDYITERTGEIADQYRSEDGDFYQLPWKSNPVMIFYNKDMFTQAGLDPENPALSTYDEFLETSRTLVRGRRGGRTPSTRRRRASSSSRGSTSTRCTRRRRGGTLLVEDGKATFDDENGAAVANFWRTIYDEELAGNEAVPGRLLRGRHLRHVDRGTVGDLGVRRRRQLGRRAGADAGPAPPRRRPTPSATPRTSASTPRARTRARRGRC